MQSAEYFLNNILRQLQQDRKKPVTEREYLNGDIVLREIIKTDRHEDFLEMIEILKEDGMIRRVMLDNFFLDGVVRISISSHRSGL